MPPEGAEVLRITAYKIRNNKIIDKYNSYIKPKKEIEKDISEITNISNNQLENARKYYEVINDFYKWWGNGPLVTDNLSFVCKFLKYYDELYSIKYPPNNCYDLYRIIKKKYPNLKSKKPQKMLISINPNYFTTKLNDEYYYVDTMWNIIKATRRINH